jgi:hypothetical protein
MTGKLMLIAGVLVAVAGSAYAQQQTVPASAAAAAQQSYIPAPTAPTADTNPDHFVKPTGYDQNPAMYPYTRKGAGPKPN